MRSSEGGALRFNPKRSAQILRLRFRACLPYLEPTVAGGILV
ncbi:MAG: hypothetical protein V1495_08135 [Pseudomonadota bacterium]